MNIKGSSLFLFFFFLLCPEKVPVVILIVRKTNFILYKLGFYTSIL